MLLPVVKGSNQMVFYLFHLNPVFQKNENWGKCLCANNRKKERKKKSILKTISDSLGQCSPQTCPKCKQTDFRRKSIFHAQIEQCKLQYQGLNFTRFRVNIISKGWKEVKDENIIQQMEEKTVKP